MTEIEDSEAADSKVPRWLIVVLLMIGTLVGVGLSAAVTVYGGIPHAYDRFGVVGVPGRQVIELPAGRVMLDRADNVYKCWDNTNHTKNPGLYKAPEGMTVRVVPMSGESRPLAITKVPGWIYSSKSGCRGHRPLGRIETPAAGKYLVETSDDKHGGFSEPPDRSGAMTKNSTSGPGIAFGPAPLATFGSPILSGLMVLVLAESLVWVPVLLWRRRGAIRSRIRLRR